MDKRKQIYQTLTCTPVLSLSIVGFRRKCACRYLRIFTTTTWNVDKHLTRMHAASGLPLQLAARFFLKSRHQMRPSHIQHRVRHGFRADSWTQRGQGVREAATRPRLASRHRSGTLQSRITLAICPVPALPASGPRGGVPVRGEARSPWLAGGGVVADGAGCCCAQRRRSFAI